MYNQLFFEAFKKMFKGFYYNVQSNESLEILSKRYKVPVNDIINVNNLTYPYTIKEGDVLYVPGIDEPTPASKGSIYTVKFGDTLESIARKYSVSSEDIMKENFTNSSVLFVGQKLLIPQSTSIDTNAAENTDAHGSTDESGAIHSQSEPIRIYPRGTDETKYDYIKTLGKKFPVMERGYKGKEVQTFQRLLSALGYSMRKIDDSFGPELEKHVLDIQKKAGMEATGVVDERMWEYVFGRINKTPITFK